jgi:cytochrome P450
VDSKHVTFSIPFRVARFELPFCAAVVRETLRKHFAFIGLMECEIPESGIEWPDGRRLPGDVVIVMHGDLIGREKGIFGEDADEFNPLRWLPQPDEPNEKYEARLKSMNIHDLAFGHGSRGCIGKHVAEMEIYKFIRTFFGLLEARIPVSVGD